MNRLPFILVLITALTSAAKAQILPPDFTCVKNDSLFWELPTNTCGAFNSYDIYGSQNQNGPFTLLASITDPAQTVYFHVNPSGAQWFFYLLSDFDCPGETALPSDTLDNRPPEISPIRSVTVNGDEVLISWLPSPSPEVVAYVIYRETPIGVIPVDTVFNGTTYLDLNANPGQQAESYLVNALDQCGNASIFDLKHKTIFLEANLEPCDRVIRLNWNTYQNWGGGIAAQELWVSENGGSPVLAQSPAPADSIYGYADITDGHTYCFYLKAFENGTAESSTSNEICIAAEIVQPANVLFIENISVGTDNQLTITWRWNTNAEITSYSIQRSPDNIDFETIAVETPTLPLPPFQTFEDAAASPNEGKVYYRIQTLDGCGEEALSMPGATVFLTGISLPGNINRLEWTPMDLAEAVPVSFDIYKILSGPPVKIANVLPTGFLFDDVFDPSNPAEALACYYVVANSSLTLPDSTLISVASQSNTACIQPPVRIYIPNAFAPEGVNNQFKPLLVLGDVVQYEMRIFDRYGQEIFYTDDPDQGWNGKKDGQIMPQGVYVYLIKASQSNDRESEKRGTLLLLR